jgi:hypothetical protein
MSKRDKNTVEQKGLCYQSQIVLLLTSACTFHTEEGISWHFLGLVVYYCMEHNVIIHNDFTKVSSTWKKMKWDSSVNIVTPCKMNDKCWIPKRNRNFFLQHHIQTYVDLVGIQGQGGQILKVITYLYSTVDCSECVELYHAFPFKCMKQCF